MKTNDDQLEGLLRRVKPRKASEGLKENVRRELERQTVQESENVPNRISIWPSLLGIAAAVVLMLTLINRGMLNKEPVQEGQTVANDGGKIVVSQEFKPLVANSVVVDCKKDGIVMNSKQKPVQKLKYKVLDHAEWKNQKSGAILAMSSPREVTMYQEVTPY